MKLWHVLIVVSGVLLLWTGIGLLLPGTLNGSNEAGVFGDQFGAVNALFSGLAFAGVIYAVILQSKELKLQREELEQTREVLKDQKRQLEEQNKTMQHQRFENTFFQLLSLHHEIVNGLEFSYSNKMVVDTGNSTMVVVKGRQCFPHFIESFQYHIQDEIVFPEGATVKDIRNAYTKFYMEEQQFVGHYFRNLYTIIKTVDQSVIQNKYAYTNVVRAQLSSGELQLLFYNCLSDWGSKFKPLVEKYSLLKNLPGSLMPGEKTKSLYASSAFKRPSTEG